MPAHPGFPATITSAVLGLRSEDEDVRRVAWERVARAYHGPIVRYVALRFRVDPSQAGDLAQAFFARCIEKRTFDAFDASKARFRTFLRTCLDRFVVDERRVTKAAKRGGGQAAVDLDDVPNAAAINDDPDAAFDLEFKKHILAQALDRLRLELRAAGKHQHLRIFERFHLESDEPPSYQALAQELGISVTDVTNRLTFARRKLRAATLDILRELTATEEEFRSEARTVLGIDLRSGGSERA